MAKTRVLNKGDKFTANVIGEGEFTYFSNIKEFADSDTEQIIAFKGGLAWIIDPCEVDYDSIPVTVVAGKAVAAFNNKSKEKSRG